MKIWAITCYFNPKKFKRRYCNYLTFKQCLDLPLLTIEWSVNGKFQLTSEDADMLIQVSGGHLMWQKERLLNIAIAHLPDNCDLVAWLDCDIIFKDHNWIEMLSSALQKNKIVQLFSQVIHPHPLPIGVYNSEDLQQLTESEDAILIRDSLTYLYTKTGQIKQKVNHNQKKPETNLGNNEEDEIVRLSKRPSSGHAWAAQRQLIEQNHFYDACICGVGDMAFALAALNLQQLFLQQYPLNQAQQSHYKLWADQFAQQVNIQVDYLPCQIFHLFHGELINRQYRTRLHTLSKSGFNPNSDLVLDQQKLWRWNSATTILPEFMDQYFERRSEDG